MSHILLFNKPYGVICQFSRNGLRPTLADYISVPNSYPAGRLDTDSEGLVLLTDNGLLQHRITDPRHKLAKVYWAQVEGRPNKQSLQQLQDGVRLADFNTIPAMVRIISEPKNLWQRTPPIRERKNKETSWLELIIREGKNRQVRRMTAAVGHPTLRLIRYQIGEWTLNGLELGAWREAAV
jgi:23S rRNA pseudouridine2457 synthase